MGINFSEENIVRLEEMSKRIRKRALDMALAAGTKGAHIGGSFSCMEIMTVLYGEVLHLDPKNPTRQDRDRLLISKNHCTIAHFPALVEAGYLEEAELNQYVKDGSRLIGYPYNPCIGLEYSGGSLGMAISVAIGQALALKRKGMQNKVYVLMGDGELNEGSVWEAFMSAAHYKLNNLVVIIDRNHLCYDGMTEEVMSLGNLEEKMIAFGWNSISCDGHKIVDLMRAFNELSNIMPNVIVANTVKGKGISFAENRPEWHQHAITEAQYEQAVRELMEG